MGRRDLDKEIELVAGVAPTNPVASIDPYYGVFVSQEEAYSLVPEGLREVGRLLAIFKDATKKNIKLFYWAKDEDGGWIIEEFLGGSGSTLPDAIISIGNITYNDVTKELLLDVNEATGYNAIRVNNIIYSKDTPDTFTIDELTDADNNFRYDLLEARADLNIFYLKKGVESPSPVIPPISDNAIYVSHILVTPEGVTITQPVDLSGYKEKIEDNWKMMLPNKVGNYLLSYDQDKKTCFSLEESGTGVGTGISTIVFETEIDRDILFLVRNNTLNPQPIIESFTNEGYKGISTNGVSETIMPKHSIFLKYNHQLDIVEYIKFGGSGGISNIVIDSTLEGLGTSASPLKVATSLLNTINSKIGKQGINLGDTGNIPEMKTGDISGIYRGNPASNPVYDFSPFMQMTTADTFAQLHFNYVNGEMAYRAGNVANGYSPIRISWDSGNLVNPATQTWVNQHYLQADSAVYAGFVAGNKEIPYIRHSDMTVVELATNTGVSTQIATKQDKSLFSALVDKWIHLYDSATAKMQPIIKLVTGAIDQLEFAGRMKLSALILPPNNNPNVANRLWSDGTYVYYDNGLAIPKRFAYTSDLDTVINYTPTGNFTMSQLKTIVENSGLKFNGIHIIIVLGSNNYTLNIDNGSTNINSLVTIGKRGTGTLNFTSSRTLTATDSITIMNGNEGSMSKIDFGTSADILTVRNI